MVGRTLTWKSEASDHLGRDGAGRREVWDTLRRTYDTASKAVHRDEVKENEGNVDLLADCRDPCRNGLLHVLCDGPVKDWTGLILHYDAGTGDSV